MGEKPPKIPLLPKPEKSLMNIRQLLDDRITAALHTLNNEHFRVVRQVLQGDNAVLEFTTQLDGIHLNGVDIIHCDAEGRIDDFKVMIRPLKAINKIHEMMGAMLEKLNQH